MLSSRLNRSFCLLLIATGTWLSGQVSASTLRAPNISATEIQEARYVTLGGIEQWITIRGADRRNPVLLLVHGGPGDAQSALRSTYQLYEKDFTIVQWDQRGAARTYLKNPNSPPEPERTGQVGSWRANLQAQFDLMLAKSRAANDRKKVELMEAIGTPDPTDAKQYFSWWRMRNPYMPAADAKWFEDLKLMIKTNPEFTEEYLKAWGDGMGISRL